ncbi:MAG TPA: FadR family transcriptional regulator [Planctomycetaceae bacterium]|uniref:FadR/GntR family transcriptional regulator n=1 Tax=Gimesia maris TaxID=122 RepID=UPI000E8A513F|nr:FCD domain-containing protein [Gimesia maris]QDU16254.1 HTH-type transcriptional regulator LutR [Gimesia maris]HAW30549.1 FadR family transcriptional regulator [Planctomycetaceae bacterium]|tara:strand:+ start:1452 stop:2147 length:696 start_codon:yes stop_codon:yes gene_type:complete
MSAEINYQITQSDELAERIRERIQSERLADGAFFMTESDLAEEYQVSRTVAREAVSRLTAIGLLEGRKRIGLIVRRPDPLRLLQLGLPSLFDSEQDVSELSMLRYVVEMGAVDLAIRNGSDEQCQQLCDLAGELAAAIRSDQAERIAELDITFHSLLLQMTSSKLIAGMQRVLVNFFQSVYQEYQSDETTGERMIWEHQELAVAIRDRDSNRARTMMQMQSRNWLNQNKTT